MRASAVINEQTIEAMKEATLLFDDTVAGHNIRRFLDLQQIFARKKIGSVTDLKVKGLCDTLDEVAFEATPGAAISYLKRVGLYDLQSLGFYTHQFENVLQDAGIKAENLNWVNYDLDTIVEKSANIETKWLRIMQHTTLALFADDNSNRKGCIAVYAHKVANALTREESLAYFCEAAYVVKGVLPSKARMLLSRTEKSSDPTEGEVPLAISSSEVGQMIYHLCSKEDGISEDETTKARVLLELFMDYREYKEKKQYAILKELSIAVTAGISGGFGSVAFAAICWALMVKNGNSVAVFYDQTLRNCPSVCPLGQ